MKRILCLGLVILSCLPLLGFMTAENTETLDLPIIMYHSVLKSRTGTYFVSPAQLEEDFKAIKEAGFTTVFMSEVINWVNNNGDLPAKPIVITFDDGYYNNIYYGLELAKKYDVKFMINPVTSYSEFSTKNNDYSNPNYSYITWSDIGAAAKSGYVEFGNHTHDLHSTKPRKGIARLKGESSAAYYDLLTKDINESQGLIEQCGCPRPTTFAYPFGKYSNESRDILLKLGFKAMLTSNQHNNKIVRGDHECLYELGRYNRDGSWNTKKLLKKIG